jgi:hypothetical protein
MDNDEQQSIPDQAELAVVEEVEAFDALENEKPPAKKGRSPSSLWDLL